MKKIKNLIKDKLPYWLKVIIEIFIKQIRPFSEDCNETYWRGRAEGTETSSVLWSNENYNLMVRKKQKVILNEFVKNLKEGSKILDMGGGTGDITDIILDTNPNISIDLVDFPEFIKRNSIKYENEKRVNLFASSAENFIPNGKSYDLIISSACYSMIKDKSKFWKSIDNLYSLTNKGGLVIMMDSFHRTKFLARVRVSYEAVVDKMQRNGFHVEKKSGFLFWPFRLFLANSSLSMGRIEKFFNFGEYLNTKFSSVFWGDYKLLIFRKR